MRVVRPPLVWAAILIVLGTFSSPAVGQPGPATEGTIFEVTVPSSLLSTDLERINTGGLAIAPGTEAVMGIDNEAIRGRLFFVESGSVEVTPLVDSLVWHGAAALGAAPRFAPAGEVAPLQPGDLVFLPVVGAHELEPGSTTTIANPGTEQAVLRGFHAHARGGGWPGWPAGIADNEGFSEGNDQDLMAVLMADGATFRWQNLTAPAGSSLPLDAAALATMVDVLAGKVERRAVDTASAPLALFWNPIHGGVIPGDATGTVDLVVAGDDPAVVQMMAILPPT